MHAPLPEPLKSALVDHLGRLKHDLGKYIAFQQRWLGAEATHDERVEALRADLLSTRRGPDGKVAATAVWAEFRPGLFGEAPLLGGPTIDVSTDTDVAALDAAMQSIDAIVPVLGTDPVSLDTLRTGEDASRAVADICRRLLTRARGEGPWRRS